MRHRPACVLCPVVGPPLRRTSCARFCHVGCAQWLEETFIQHGLVHGLRNVSRVLLLLVLTNWLAFVSVSSLDMWLYVECTVARDSSIYGVQTK